MPSHTTENYLKTLYHLQENREDLIPLGELSRELELTPGTVTTMVRRFSEKGWIRYVPRKGARLTNEGEKTALKVVRRHRLIELFLVEALGLKWDEVHEEAEILEHALSDRLIEKISDFLGNPEFDPHGAAIPTSGGKLPPQVRVSLSKASPGSYKIVQVTDHTGPLLKHLKKVGLTPGTLCKLVRTEEIAGLVVLKKENEPNEIHLGLSAASSIWVTPRDTRLPKN